MTGDAATRRLAALYILFLAVIYALQAFTPLRINTDSYRLLSMAVSAREGHGYLVDGQPDQFPRGYPFIVKTLLQRGLASSMSLVLLNLLCLMVGLWVLSRWSTTQTGRSCPLWTMAFVVSSWVVIKHVTIPLTEFAYLGLSSLSLFFVWLFYRQDGPGKWRWFAASVVLGYLALQCRSAGLTLFPVLAITALLHSDHAPFLRRMTSDRWRRLAILSGATILSVLALAVIRKTGWYRSQFVTRESYFHALVTSTTGGGILNVLLRNVRGRILEFGEIFANLPLSKVPRLGPLFYGIGLLAWLAVARGAWLLSRSRDKLPLSLYFLMYSAPMFLWPFYDARFWLPLFPVLALMLRATLSGLEKRWPVVRYAARTYLATFLFLGLISLAFSTRLSLAGKEFGELYGDGKQTMTYRFAFKNRPCADMSDVSETKVRLLRLFEPLARAQ